MTTKFDRLVTAWRTADGSVLVTLAPDGTPLVGVGRSGSAVSWIDVTSTYSADALPPKVLERKATLLPNTEVFATWLVEHTPSPLDRLKAEVRTGGVLAVRDGEDDVFVWDGECWRYTAPLFTGRIGPAFSDDEISHKTAKLCRTPTDFAQFILDAEALK